MGLFQLRPTAIELRQLAPTATDLGAPQQLRPHGKLAFKRSGLVQGQPQAPPSMKVTRVPYILGTESYCRHRAHQLTYSYGTVRIRNRQCTSPDIVHKLELRISSSRRWRGAIRQRASHLDLSDVDKESLSFLAAPRAQLQLRYIYIGAR